LDKDIVLEVANLMNDIQDNLLKRATERRDKMTYEAKSLGELKDIIENHPGFVRADWCGDVECENKIKEIRGCKSRCIMEGEKTLTGKCVVCGKDAKCLVTWGVQY
jgi:prolyl-tRNA synthetase